jgi:hypothetical protein
MPTPAFEFFEDICNELVLRNEAVLPEDELLSDDRLRELQDEYGGVGADVAVQKALLTLAAHFKARGSDLPFQYDHASRTFTVRDKDYIEFVATASSIRGVGKRSRVFEEAMTRRLSLRGSGTFYRVGWPRGTRKKRREFITYLRNLGFNNKVIFGREKDGGLDVLWLLPLGAVPHRPIVSIQCKNGSFSLPQADQSNGPARRSLGCHRGLQVNVHTLCVVFNDYIDKRILAPKAFDFVALGLSDLAAPTIHSQFRLL